MFLLDKLFKHNKLKNKPIKFYQSLDYLHIENNTLLNLNRAIKSDSCFVAIRNQARNLALNNSLMCGYFHTLQSEILGDEGLVLDVSTDDEQLNKDIMKRWFDFELESDWEDLEAAALFSYVRDGECFLHLQTYNNTLRLQLLDSAKFNHTSQNAPLSIEFNKLGAPEAFYYVSDDNKTLRLNASDVIYFKHNPDPFAVRGISMLAPIIAKVSQLDELARAELNRARLQSELTGFIKEKDNPLEIYSEDEDIDVELPKQVEVGKMQLLPSGVEVQMLQEYNPVAIKDFMLFTRGEIAKALCVSYSTLTGDLSQVNFSSLRQGALNERRLFKRLQKKLARCFHGPIFKRWLELELLNKRISFEQAQKVLGAFMFKGQGFEAIDPTKDAQANDIQLKNGTKSFSEVLRERGKELDTHLAELKKESELIQILKERNGL